MENIREPAHNAGGALYEVGKKSTQLTSEVVATRDAVLEVYAKLGGIIGELEAVKAELEEVTSNSLVKTTAGEVIESAEQASEALTPLALTTSNPQVNEAMRGAANTAEMAIDTGMSAGGAIVLAQEQAEVIDASIAKLKEIETNTPMVAGAFNGASASSTAQGAQATAAKDQLDAYLNSLGLPPSPEGS